MHLPHGLARFNRRVTNPMLLPWAGRAPMFAIVEHVGRRSGKAYSTPLSVFTAEVDGRPGVAALLAYGPECDWLKNLKAAGGGRVRHRGKAFDIAEPRVVSKAEAARFVCDRPDFARVPFEQAVLLIETE